MAFSFIGNVVGDSYENVRCHRWIPYCALRNFGYVVNARCEHDSENEAEVLFERRHLRAHDGFFGCRL